MRGESEGAMDDGVQSEAVEEPTEIDEVMRPLLFDMGALSLTWGREGAWHLCQSRIRKTLSSLGIPERYDDMRAMWLRERPTTGGYWQ